MQNIFDTIMTDGALYLVLAFISFLNIIVPISGSATQTPLIATLTGDPHYAITVATWLLMISCGIITLVFRGDIRWDYFWKLFPASIIGTIVGAYLLIQLPGWLVTTALLILSVRFLYKKLKNFLSKHKEQRKEKETHHLVGPVIALFSSFLQGTGMSGSSLREGFLYSENLKIEQVRGTAEILNFFIFATASLVRFQENQMTFSDMVKWTVIFTPILFVAIYLGRKVLVKFSDKVKDTIIIVLMSYIVIALLWKIFNMMSMVMLPA